MMNETLTKQYLNMMITDYQLGIAKIDLPLTRNTKLQFDHDQIDKFPDDGLSWLKDRVDVSGKDSCTCGDLCLDETDETILEEVFEAVKIYHRRGWVSVLN